MAGLLPASEEELQASRPGVNQPNCFPRSSLAAGEKVIFEARPEFIGYHRVLLYITIPLFLFFTLIAAVGLAEFGPGYIRPAAFILMLFGLPILFAAVSRSRAAYALTDKRVLSREGGDAMESSLQQVRNVRAESHRVIFELDPPVGPTEHGRPRPSQVVWPAVPGVLAVAPFVSSAVAFYRLKGHASELRDELTERAMARKVVCSYCGLLVDTSQVAAVDPRCPGCNAPLALPPAGVDG